MRRCHPLCDQRVHCVSSIVGSNTRPGVRFDAMYHDDVLITYQLTNLLYMADANGDNDGGHDDDNRRSFKRLPESPTGSSPTLRSGSIIRPTSAHGFSAGEILNRVQKKKNASNCDECDGRTFILHPLSLYIVLIATLFRWNSLWHMSTPSLLSIFFPCLLFSSSFCIGLVVTLVGAPRVIVALLALILLVVVTVVVVGHLAMSRRKKGRHHCHSLFHYHY